MSKLDDILEDSTTRAYCSGQDWNKTNPDRYNLDGIDVKAKQQIKELVDQTIANVSSLKYDTKGQLKDAIRKAVAEL